MRVLARDGNLILSQTDATKLAGPLLFTTTTTPGMAMDGIFYWTGKGLNWDVYGHNPRPATPSRDAAVLRTRTATTHRQRRAGDRTTTSGARDHNKPLETKPVRRRRQAAAR